MKKSKLTTQRPVFGNNDSGQSRRLNHCCVERPVKIRLLLTKTRGRLFQHNKGAKLTGWKWAGSGKAAFISLSGLSGQRLLTESQAGALEHGLEKPLLA
ncbi:hypothetical protein [Sphingomonas koreensis]|uniref:hypothetical protein n=1 Tax=Sphingomonas koreensis TaxID=93064 RepID=UPI000F7F61B5|nr:hypothetical protein [Sphingomonas koreensis]